MKGQWLGAFTGSTAGEILVNVDETRATFRGTAYLTDPADNAPPLVASFETIDKGNPFTVQANIATLGPRGLFEPWDSLKARFPNTEAVSTRADVHGGWNDEMLRLTWTTDIGATGECILPISKAGTPSELPSQEMDWAGYKNYVAGLESKDYLFRGQTEPWRLRTAFHRSGRSDLLRYRTHDIPALRTNNTYVRSSGAGRIWRVSKFGPASRLSDTLSGLDPVTIRCGFLRISDGQPRTSGKRRKGTHSRF